MPGFRFPSRAGSFPFLQLVTQLTNARPTKTRGDRSLNDAIVAVDPIPPVMAGRYKAFIFPTAADRLPAWFEQICARRKYPYSENLQDVQGINGRLRVSNPFRTP